MLRSALAVVAVSLFVPSLVASIGGQPEDLAALAKGADRIVVGKVSEVHSAFGRNRHGDQVILSQVALEITETLKGTAATLLSVEIEGGTVGDLTLRVSDMPELTPGERGVLPGPVFPRPPPSV